ncbi:GTPase Era [Siphonobacter aquaeclarae]|jgi:GTP-binding protein Era|uniref:GTPase Era n=1 Tax=Siphonobacter aquaeclarae TaxID=563176 RepID=A0A1G9M664_9BACT|nr:GTPase Era [Siphonobacter aquaeclarae]SDL69708.1 GTP-binding protein Era [Siphonobacter aquaeclarae]
MEQHKTGYVSIIGKPNVGKSTLMNALVGERLSIITSKAQTTRHRIMGIVNGVHDDIPFQLVYSDTPGIIKPQYQLHESMMNFVKGSLQDADVILFVTDIFEKYDEDDVIEKLTRIEDIPVILLINKVDLATQEQVEEKIAYWRNRFATQTILPISALHKSGLEEIFSLIFKAIPFHPPFFDKDSLTDRPERFFAAEIIREKIFLNYKKEIPYSSEVVITSFKETDDIIRILAEIYVERTSQRAILLGHKGASIKKVGIESRKEMEAFFGKQIHLETYVRVESDWRSKANKLREFGYIQE